MNLPFEAILAATNATVLGEPVRQALRIVTDTRALRRGDAFLALRGERFDGHDFLREAVARGAAALIVDRPQDVTGPAVLVVKNTLQAYLQLASAARERFNGRVLAITGSAGKTTTKVFTDQLLRTRYGDRVLTSPANENNEIGVSKLLLQVENALHDVMVVEMGARHFGDIATLTVAAKPDVAVLTNIGDAHLEIMGSRERLEETKFAIFGGGARPILNAHDDASVRRAQDVSHAPYWFFAGSSDDALPDVATYTALLGRRMFMHQHEGAVREHMVNVRVPGDHNRANLAAAAAAALELGADFNVIANALEDVVLPAGRYETIDIAGIRVIYDAYNANASGTIAALDTFADEPAKRRIALLSSMAELGDEAPQLHRRVAAHAATSNVDILLVGGDFADDLALGAQRAGLSSERIVHFASNAQAAAWLRANACEGDAVLLKGSRKYKLEEIVMELRA